MPGRGHKHILDGTPVLVTENVAEYRRAIPQYISADDIVLELGCAEGVTTALIAEYAKQVVGVDKSEGQRLRAQNRHPHVQFHNIDAFDISSILKLNLKFTKIFVDVSGSRPVGDVAELIDSYGVVFSPELFIVKCFKLKRLIGMCKTFPVDIAGQQHAAYNITLSARKHPRSWPLKEDMIGQSGELDEGE